MVEVFSVIHVNNRNACDAIGICIPECVHGKCAVDD